MKIHWPVLLGIVFILLYGCLQPGFIVRFFKGFKSTASVIPLSKRPGPPLQQGLALELTDSTALRMSGKNDPVNERWADIQGNYYTGEFISRFNYVTTPTVRVKINAGSQTFSGRIEALGLKPNFCYQLKLVGDFTTDRTSFEAIGRIGRWRLPGKGTNYTDEDYAKASEEVKSGTSAYILFDYLVTDKHGNAVREFGMDSSLHVIWNASRQRTADEEDYLAVKVDAGDSAVYARPKSEVQTELLWAERERHRYESADAVIRLPAGQYSAALELTEESFHARSRDGGWWATVMTVPVTFSLIP